MFRSARIKLTAWYLLLIMLITSLFSIAFFYASTAEIQRIINRIEFEQTTNNSLLLPPGPPGPPFSLEELQQSKNRLIWNLVVINGFILVCSGGAGYFLAGRTLKPIKLMIDEQNQFITNSSHELRTPIAVMRSEMEAALLEKHISENEAKSLIKSNLEELGILQTLTNNLLKLSQMQDVGFNFIPQNVSILDVISLSKKRVEVLAKQKNIKIIVKVGDDNIQGNKNSLAELFIILLDNAIKYSPSKTIIKITSESIGNNIRINVSDQGNGISSKDLPHIFERFYRSDKSRFQSEGYGLGLSIAKKIVNVHNGFIVVKSNQPKGTIFIVQLPKLNKS